MEVFVTFMMTLLSILVNFSVQQFYHGSTTHSHNTQSQHTVSIKVYFIQNTSYFTADIIDCLKCLDIVFIMFQHMI